MNTTVTGSYCRAHLLNACRHKSIKPSLMKTWQHVSILSLVNRSFKSHSLLTSPPSQTSNLLLSFSLCVTKRLLLLLSYLQIYIAQSKQNYIFLLIVPAIVIVFKNCTLFYKTLILLSVLLSQVS